MGFFGFPLGPFSMNVQERDQEGILLWVLLS